MSGTPLPKTIGKPATRALEARGITTLEELAQVSNEEILSWHGIGPKAANVLQQALKNRK